MKATILAVAALAVILVPGVALAHGHYGKHHRGPQVPPVVSPVVPPVVAPPSVPTPPTVPTPPVGSVNEVSLTAYVTSYQSGDNDPAGSTGIYINGVSGNAGGTGTYSDPITVAVGYVGNKADFPTNTKFYIPSLQKYFIANDTCAECHQTPKGVQVWLDIWSGNYASQKGLQCEDALTDNYTVVENPASTYPVNITPLFNGTTCIK